MIVVALALALAGKRQGEGRFCLAESDRLRSSEEQPHRRPSRRRRRVGEGRCHNLATNPLEADSDLKRRWRFPGLSMRPSGLELPPGKPRTGPSTLYEMCRYVQQRPDRPYRQLFWSIGGIRRYGRCQNVATDVGGSG